MAGAPLMVPVDKFGADDGEAALSVFVLAFGTAADALARYGAGDAVSVSGRLRLAWYATRDGEARESWQCIADAVVSSRCVRPRGCRMRKASESRMPPGSPTVGDGYPFDDPIPI